MSIIDYNTFNLGVVGLTSSRMQLNKIVLLLNENDEGVNAEKLLLIHEYYCMDFGNILMKYKHWDNSGKQNGASNEQTMILMS